MDSGCQHGNGGFLDAYMAREGFWLHTREGSGFDCLDVDGKGEISGCLHGKGGVLAGCKGREGFWLHAREGGILAACTGRRDSGCRHGKGWILAACIGREGTLLPACE